MLARTQLPDGAEYWPLDPKRSIPSVENISGKLAQTNRFGGSCLFPYSVGQHSIIGAKALLRDGYQPKVALAFLFHDAAEPLGFCDLAAPIKYGNPETWRGYANPAYWLIKLFTCLHKWLEGRILSSLLDHYGVAQDTATWEVVYEYDRRIIADEKTQVMLPSKFNWGTLPKPLDVEIKEMDWQEVRDEWLRLYNILVWE